MEELESVEVKVSAAGNEQYAAWREGTQDDLVSAVELASWSAAKAFPEDARGTARWWTRGGEGLGLGVVVRRGAGV